MRRRLTFSLGVEKRRSEGVRHAARTLLIACALLATLGWALLAEPCTIIVQPGESIQAAIDAAPDGSVLCLPAGAWEEQIAIRKNLTLRGSGAGETMIRGHEEAVPVILIHPPSGNATVVVLENLTVTEGQGLWLGDALRIEGAARVSLQGVSLEDSEAYGIRLGDTASVTIVDSLIRGNRDGIQMRQASRAMLERCRIEGSERYGIMLLQSAAICLRATSITDNGFIGLGMDHATQATVEGSLIAGHGYGLQIIGTAQVVVRGSTIEENLQHGVLALDSARVVIEESLLRSHGDDAVRVRDVAHVTIADSTLSGNGTGIFMMNESHVIVEGTVIEDNRSAGIAMVDNIRVTIRDTSIRRQNWGVSVMSESHDVSIERTIIEENRQGVSIGEAAWAKITDSLIANNVEQGVFVVHQGQVIIQGSTIKANGQYGVAVLERPCIDRDRQFLGYITGLGNTIPGPDEEGGNARGAVCPEDLAFLMTEEGGALDRRE